MRRHRPRAIVIAFGILFYGVLLGNYLAFIVPREFYVGMIARPLPAVAWLLSITLFVTPLLWLPLALKRPSDYAAWVLYLGGVAPTSLIAFQVSTLPPLDVAWIPAAYVAAFGVFEYLRRRPAFEIPAFKDSGPVFSVGLPVVLLLASMFAFAAAGFHFDLGLSTVYERRMAARESLPARSLMAYAVSLLGTCLLPLAAIVAWRGRRLGLALLAGLAMLSVFSINGKKSTVVLPLIIVGILLIARTKPYGRGLMLLKGAIATCLASAAAEILLRSDAITVYLVRRVFATPGQLTTYYFEFFRDHPHVHLSDSVLGFGSFRPYELSTPFLIGSAKLADSNIAANVGIWPNAYAQFGLPGVFGVSIIAALAFRLIDGGASRGRHSVATGIAAAVGLIWSEQALHTSLISSGVAFLLIALLLFPPEAAGSSDVQALPKLLPHAI